MRFNINSNTLNEALSIAKKAIPNNDIMPVLEGIYLETKEDGLKIRTNNLAIGITIRIEDCEVEQQDKVVVDGKSFIGYLRNINNREILLYYDNNELILEDGENKAKFKTFNVSNYPAEKTVSSNKKISLPKSIMRDIINKTSFVIPNKAENDILTTLFVRPSNGKLEAVATDTFHLSYYEYQNESINNLPSFSITKDCLKLIKEMNDDTESINLYPAENHLMVKNDKNTIKIISQFINGEYPNYKRIMPKDELGITARIERDTLINSINKGLIMAGSEQVLSYDFNDALLISNINKDIGHFKDKIEYELSGSNDVVSVDSYRLLQAIKKCSDTVTIKKNKGENNPLIVEENNWIYILMPIRQSKK